MGRRVQAMAEGIKLVVNRYPEFGSEHGLIWNEQEAVEPETG